MIFFDEIKKIKPKTASVDPQRDSFCFMDIFNEIIKNTFHLCFGYKKLYQLQIYFTIVEFSQITLPGDMEKAVKPLEKINRCWLTA